MCVAHTSFNFLAVDDCLLTMTVQQQLDQVF